MSDYSLDQQARGAGVDAQPLVPSTQFLKPIELRRGLELLTLAYRDLLRLTEADLEAIGLGTAHYRAMFLVAQHPGISVGRLCRLLGITKQSLGRVLDTLEAEGYITRHKDPIDQRVRRLDLTGKGKELETKLFDSMQDKLSRAYSAVGQQNVAGFWQTLLYLTGEEAKEVLLAGRKD